MKFKTEKDIAKYYWIPYRTYLSRIRAWTLEKPKRITWRDERIAQAKKEYEDAKAGPKYEIVERFYSKSWIEYEEEAYQEDNINLNRMAEVIAKHNKDADKWFWWVDTKNKTIIDHWKYTETITKGGIFEIEHREFTLKDKRDI